MRIKLKALTRRVAAIFTLVVLVIFTQSGRENYDEAIDTCHVSRLGSWKTSVKYTDLHNNLTNTDMKMSRDWQTVTEENNMFVYSAFREKLFPDRIRIIGSSYVLSRNPTKVFCLYYYDDEDYTLLMVEAQEVLVFDGHWFKYYTSYFVCPLCNLPLPERISLVDEAHAHKPNNILPVHDQTANEIQYNITSCVSPLFGRGNSSKTEVLIEWFEMNLILGIEFFNIYVNNISDVEMKVLDYYQSIGKAKIMSWALPGNEFSTIIHAKGIHYLGQLAALNDCLYRNKGRTKYMVTYDIDELIIPRLAEDMTLLDGIKHLPDKSVYSVHNAYFKYGGNLENCTFKNNCLSKIDKSLKDTRTNLLFYPTDINKLIVKPKDVVTIGVHHPFAMRAGPEYLVPRNICLLHHFSTRHAEDIERRFLQDDASTKYHDVLLEHALHTVAKINAMS